MTPIITSLLDTRPYKFTMWQAMLHRHPQTEAEYEFVCRTPTAFPLADLLPEVNRELDALCSLRFDQSELDYLASLRFMKATSSTFCASSSSSAPLFRPGPRATPCTSWRVPAGACDGL
ncbi:hypothetical protein J4711_13660 [Staphylococcus epidermidis]|nr:hypothetical protein [Staphylococcus epidermidis]